MKFLLVILMLPALSAAADLEGISDRALKIDMLELRGVKAGTKNSLFVKVVVQRGRQKFEVFCARKGRLDAESTINILDCGENAETVSNDDDESFFFEIAHLTRDEGTEILVQNISYSGDGTFLGYQAEILSGLKHSDRRLEDLSIGLRRGNRGSLQAFDLGVVMEQALDPLLGREITVRDDGVKLDLKIKELRYSLSSDMNAQVSVRLDTSHLENISVRNPGSVSLHLLTQHGQLDSGLRAPADLSQEISAALEIK